MWITAKCLSPASKALKLYFSRLIGICGSVGSGKSSLVSTMLGQTVFKSGHLGLNGTIAYVPQQAWIFHASVRENILFGLPWDEQKYNKGILVDSSCLHYCIFEPDSMSSSVY